MLKCATLIDLLQFSASCVCNSLHTWVGRQPSVQVSQRPEVSTAETSIHKLLGDVSSRDGTHTLSGQIAREASVRSDRQRDGCVVSLKRGGTRSLLLSLQVLLWSQRQRTSIQAVYVNGILNTVDIPCPQTRRHKLDLF